MKVEPALHAEVLERYAALDLPSYFGFIQPRLTPVKKAGAIVDVEMTYPTDFAEQQLRYSRAYGLLPVRN